jgi:hypothetical protein
MKHPLRSIAALACAIGSLGVAQDANADEVRFGPNDVASVFFIAKSENRNEVHYAVRLDASCAPAGAQPVFAYWREIEKGPNVTSELLGIEQQAYGIARQQVSHGRIRLALRALPSRTIVIETRRTDDGKCAATATLAIAGTPARLERVFAQIAWPAGVDFLMLEGAAVSDGRALRERVEP